MWYLQKPERPLSDHLERQLRAQLRTQVRDGDFDRYLCAQFAAPDRRPALLAVLAFALEVGQVRARATREPFMATLRFAWWREALDAIYGGPRVPDHPVLMAMAGAVQRHGLSRAPFDAVLAASEAEMELSDDIETIRSVSAGLGAGPLLSWLEVLGVQDRESAEAARDAGTAWALLRRAASARERGPILAAAAEHIAAGRGRRSEVARAALPALLPMALAARSLRVWRATPTGQEPRADGRVRRQLSLLGYALLGRY